MASGDQAAALFDSPYLLLVVEYLDPRSALFLRATCHTGRGAFSIRELSRWRQSILPLVLRGHFVPPPGQDPRFWYEAPAATDAQLGWLFDNGEEVGEVDLGRAPFPTDVLLEKISAECPNLVRFSVTRGENNLRIYFHAALRGITTAGASALLRRCRLLRELRLSWCEHVHGDSLFEAVRGVRLEEMRVLDLDGVPTSDRAVQAIAAACPNLESLRMRDTCARDLSPLAACTSMTKLHICRGRGVSPAGVVAACRGFRGSIVELCCMGCGLIDNDAALEILRMCRELQEWDCVRGTLVERDVVYDAAMNADRIIQFDSCR